MRFLGVGLCVLSALVVCAVAFASCEAMNEERTSYQDSLDNYEDYYAGLDETIPVEPLQIRDVDGSELDTYDLSDPSEFFRLIDYNTGELGHGYIRCRTVVYVDSTWCRYPTGMVSWDAIVPIRMDTLFVQVFERP